MSSQRKIYTLDHLTPEVRAVTFAKCSRSPESFEEIAQELTEKKSSEFHEKWVVGYGHSSVAEHAVLSLAIENVSILATKVIEDNRLASYTEKSTRYQIFDRSRYYKPKKIMESSWGKLYENTINYFFDLYQELTPVVMEFVKKRHPQKDTPEGLYKTMMKAKACDIIRYILPSSTLTNLGMTINARSLEYAISKLLSHPLDEMKEIGKEIKEVSQKTCPTLIKYADHNPYLMETNQTMETLIQKTLNFPQIDNQNSVTLINYDKEAEDKLISSLLYRYSPYPYQQIKERIDTMSFQEKEKIIDESLKRKKKFDHPLRELEHLYYTFDLLLDYGAFRDVQRHRMCTQTNQDITVEHGYSMCEEIKEAGLENKYRECMEKAKNIFDKIKKEFPKEVQYLVPLAYKKRVLITWNLRELHHFIPLRSGKQGHISYRRIAQQVWNEINKVHPLLAKYIEVDKS